MSFDPNKPVSLEEYNAILSRSYAMIYEHMKNDPTLTQEEFIQQASAMSEKYHEAIQEFQEMQDTQNGANMNTNEGIQAGSETLDIVGISTVDAETVDGGVSADDGVSTSGVDNDDGIDNDSGIDNDGDGIDDSMDI